MQEQIKVKEKQNYVIFQACFMYMSFHRKETKRKKLTSADTVSLSLKEFFRSQFASQYICVCSGFF